MIPKTAISRNDEISGVTADAASFRLRDVTAVRGGRVIFRNLNIMLRAGEILHLCGANGRGKTTALRMMAGLLLPSEGAVEWVTETEIKNNLEKDVVSHTARVAFMPSGDGYLKNNETVAETLRFWAAATAGPASIYNDATKQDTGCETILDRLQLRALSAVPVRKLSAGQRRRVSWARLLVKPRPLWLLDEPFNALDTAGMDIAGNLIAAQADLGGMVVLAGHQPLPQAIAARARVVTL